MATRLGTNLQWKENNPIPADGDTCISTDTGRRKVGDGSSTWKELDFQAVDGLRDTPLKYSVIGDSTAETIKHSAIPHPVAMYPLPVTMPGSGLNTFRTVNAAINALQTHYPMAFCVQQMGMGGETVANVLSRDASGYANPAGRSVTDAISLGLDVIFVRIGVNDLATSTTSITAAQTQAQNDAAYAVWLADHKTLIGRLLKTGAFIAYEGIAGYGGGSGSMSASLADRTARAPYVIKLMNDLSAYIATLNADRIVYVDPRGKLCSSADATFLPGMSSDGVHLLDAGGYARATLESELLTLRFGKSAPIAYPGVNKADTLVPPMMLTKVNGTYGDLATGIVIQSVANGNPQGVIEEIDGQTWQSWVITPTNPATTTSVFFKIDVTAANMSTFGMASTDVIGVEYDVILETFGGVFAANNSANFEAIYKLAQSGQGTVSTSYKRFFSGEETKIKMHVPLTPIILSIDPATVQYSNIVFGLFLGTGQVGQTYKMSVTNVRYVINPKNIQ